MRGPAGAAGQSGTARRPCGSASRAGRPRKTMWTAAWRQLSGLRTKHAGIRMSESADVVIIGGGIVGSSIAWHLTEAGCRNVLVIERETHQGKGSTGKSMGDRKSGVWG